MDYEFNAPLYLDFDNPDSQEVQCLGQYMPNETLYYMNLKNILAL